MKVKLGSLEGEALDRAVALAHGWTVWDPNYPGTGLVWATGDERSPTVARFRPSTDWSAAGPIIEREKIDLGASCVADLWDARMPNGNWIEGPTPLIAAMRAYVASKFGDTVELPS